MGYRSDVFCEIKIEGKDPKDLYQEVLAITQCEDLFDYVTVNKENNSLMLIANYVKWYVDIYPEVTNFHNWLKNLGCDIEANEEQNKTDWIYFVRLGEDYSDIEECFYGENSYESGFKLNRYVDIETAEEDQEVLYEEKR